MLNPINKTNGHNGHNGHYANGHLNGNGYGHDMVAVPLEKTAEKLAIESAVRTILDNVGEDSDRDGLIGTPDRIARMYNNRR